MEKLKLLLQDNRRLLTFLQCISLSGIVLLPSSWTTHPAVWREGCYALSQLISFLNTTFTKNVLENDQLSDPTNFLSLIINALQHVEVFCEKVTGTYGSSKLQEYTIILIEAIKACFRLSWLLLKTPRNRMMLNWNKDTNKLKKIIDLAHYKKAFSTFAIKEMRKLQSQCLIPFLQINPPPPPPPSNGSLTHPKSSSNDLGMNGKNGDNHKMIQLSTIHRKGPTRIMSSSSNDPLPHQVGSEYFASPFDNHLHDVPNPSITTASSYHTSCMDSHYIGRRSGLRIPILKATGPPQDIITQASSQSTFQNQSSSSSTNSQSSCNTVSRTDRYGSSNVFQELYKGFFGYFPTNPSTESSTATDSRPGLNHISTLSSTHNLSWKNDLLSADHLLTMGEVLYILRPVVYVLILRQLSVPIVKQSPSDEDSLKMNEDASYMPGLPKVSSSWSDWIATNILQLDSYHDSFAMIISLLVEVTSIQLSSYALQLVRNQVRDNILRTIRNNVANQSAMTSNTYPHLSMNKDERYHRPSNLQGTNGFHIEDDEDDEGVEKEENEEVEDEIEESKDGTDYQDVPEQFNHRLRQFTLKTSHEYDKELLNRKILLLYYFIRSPLFNRLTYPMLKKLSRMVQKVPLIHSIPEYLLSILQYLNQTHFYHSNS